MGVGPLGGIHTSAAGVPYAQAKGPDVERTEHETIAQQRHSTSERLADAAAGIGETGEDSEASERDADGRRLWEEQAGKKQHDEGAADEPTAPPSKDATGESGRQLDLTG
ncbi:MAG: hypothetical protein KF708_08480 [Pirellulales bacterium]|nr:hypothetical protein [Pirellulales bacterium]